MSDPFYLYPSETTKQLDALLGTPILGPEEFVFYCKIPRDSFDTTYRVGPESWAPAIGRRGSQLDPQPIGPRPCHTCPHYVAPFKEILGHDVIFYSGYCQHDNIYLDEWTPDRPQGRHFRVVGGWYDEFTQKKSRQKIHRKKSRQFDERAERRGSS